MRMYDPKPDAPVSVVTVAQGGVSKGPGLPVFGVWDTHTKNFPSKRKILPEYDRAIYTLLTDLYERGLDQQVAVVIWGEFGRSPRIGDEVRALGSRCSDGRGHYSLGCTFYCLLTRQAVYSGNTQMERIMAHRFEPIPSLVAARMDIPEGLDAIFQKMIAKDRQDRYQSMTEVLTAIAPYGTSW